MNQLLLLSTIATCSSSRETGLSSAALQRHTLRAASCHDVKPGPFIVQTTERTVAAGTDLTAFITCATDGFAAALPASFAAAFAFLEHGDA